MAERGRLTANLAAVGVLVAVAAGVLLWQRPWATPDSQQPGPPVAIPDDSRALLAQTFRALTDADTRDEFVAAAGRSKAARTFAGSVWTARSRLGVKRVGLVYEQGGDASDRADGSTSARVKVTWTPSGASVFAGAHPAASEVRFRLIPRSDGHGAGRFEVVSASAFGRDRLPIWLAGPVRLARDGSATTLMVGAAPRACNRVPTQASAAIEAVRRVQPEAQSDLVVVCPRSAAITAALLGRSPSDVAQIAAVSTSLGGTRGTPAIVLNPKLFGTMDARARQVVMSHEATHVLTGVIGKKLDLWVAEGFADFVALRTDKAPLSVSAGQILGQVRAGGAPKHLPADADFDESAHGLGAVYESAWMVFRMLADQFGEASVTAFYRDVVGGVPVADATTRRFGWSRDELTAAWRRYLTKSASTVS